MVYSQANCVYVHHMVFICDFNLVETWIPLDMFITFLHLSLWRSPCSGEACWNRFQPVGGNVTLWPCVSMVRNTKLFTIYIPDMIHSNIINRNHSLPSIQTIKFSSSSRPQPTSNDDEQKWRVRVTAAVLDMRIVEQSWWSLGIFYDRFLGRSCYC